ncbi:TlpA family protein disulfide reductase [Chitinophaga sp. XS-30]|uniref:TlpA family protein disulfide reductase n=1 Tax=Chitinophaga sp. XS-30 TaxID=2604421 RepID=UPI0011DDC6CE|nr:TlpA family protein disulfide reductase [Chitinophaga sp. XS-30]QEH41096.1 redoxin domain-containing protein [Chitinophaga sp. XS-30]
MKKLLPFLLFFCCPAFSQEVTRVPVSGLDALLRHPDTALVVNLWATWCAPCVKEIPHFEKQAKALKGQQVKFIFLSLDMEDAYPKKIQQFIRRRQLDSPVFWLDEQNANKYARTIHPRWQGSIPATIFINTAKGYRKFVEGEISEARLKKEISSMME